MTDPRTPIDPNAQLHEALDALDMTIDDVFREMHLQFDTIKAMLGDILDRLP